MKNKFEYTLLLTSLLMGLLLVWQISSEVPIEGNFVSDEVEAQELLLKSFLDEQAYLQSRIVTLRNNISDAQGELENQSKSINFEMLESLKKDVGLTEITGPGITIVLDDSPVVQRSDINVDDTHLIQASDIRDVVNLLNAANAEAISINGQRIIATSPINSVGTTILVNNSHVAPPFNITAVGDVEVMLQRILDVFLLPDLYEKMRKTGIVFEITKSNRLTVPIYNADLKTSYLNLVNE